MSFLKLDSAIGVFLWVIQNLNCRLELQVKVNKCRPIGKVGFVEGFTTVVF